MLNCFYVVWREEKPAFRVKQYFKRLKAIKVFQAVAFGFRKRIFYLSIKI